MSKSSLALNNLRGVTIVIVLAFHSVLAYLNFLPASPYRFDASPYQWRAFPIVDSHRWFGFDLFCAWQDVYLMAFMFFLSALFTWPSLKRKGVATFLGDRAQRLGVPFLVGVLVVIPLALYPVYRLGADDPSVSGYLHHYLALPFWPNGPLWFLWLLLALTGLAAALHRFAPQWIDALARRSAAAGDRPGRYFLALDAIAALAYVPLALAFTPFRWAEHGPLAIQYSRPLLYAVFYVAGLALGANGLDRGLVATDGALARHWSRWLAAALGSLVAWMGLTKLAMDLGASAPLALEIAVDISFVIACTAGCFFVLGAALRFGTARSRILDNLAENAFSLYLVHYVFVVWLQYALLGETWPAVAKAAIVFGGTLALSWAVILAARTLPFGAYLVGAPRRVQAKPAPGRPAIALSRYRVPRGEFQPPNPTR